MPQEIASQLELLFEAGIGGKLNAVALGGAWVDALGQLGVAGNTSLGRSVPLLCGSGRILEQALRLALRE